MLQEAMSIRNAVVSLAMCGAKVKTRVGRNMEFVVWIVADTSIYFYYR